MAKCRHTHAWFVIDRHGSRRGVWGIYQAWMVHNDPHFGYSDMDTVISASCRNCSATLSLGPSNDEPALVACEITRAAWITSDSGWSRFDDEGAFDWDVTRPLAEQWPWGPAEPAHMARGDAMLDEAIASTERTESYVPHLSAYLDALDDVELPRVERDVQAMERSCDAFAPSDTASREPWHTTEETQESGDLETQLRAAADEFLDGTGTEVPDGAA